MDPTLVVAVIVALLLGSGGGFFVGRSASRASVLEEGRRSGRDEGRREGSEKGRARGIEEGRETGRREAREAIEARLEAFVEALERGRPPPAPEPGSVEARIQGALERGWAPREQEREAALREAVGRVSAFLHAQVRAPLEGVTDETGAAELRERIARAMGALSDLDFFLTDAAQAREGTDLAKLAQRVAHEFAGDQDVGVRLMLGQATVRADVNPNGLMDALYLVLHNAARFGGGSTVDLTLEEREGRARLVVRDRGAGFSEEAFARAFDPFYSTSPEGLGLGLPHARKLVEDMGGVIELRNRPDGGAEVEISFARSG